MSKLRYLFPSSTLLLLYYSFIHPHFLFVLPLCGNTNPAYLTKIQCLRNKVVRLITNSELRASINTYYFKLGILKLPELYKLEIAKLMHQRYQQNLPPALQNFSNHFLLFISVQLDQNQKINFIYRNFPRHDVKNLGILSHLK